MKGGSAVLKKSRHVKASVLSIIIQYQENCNRHEAVNRMFKQKYETRNILK